jgi:hypothetical protein
MNGSERFISPPVTQVVENLHRQGEQNRRRLGQDEARDGFCVVGVHEVARIDEANPDASVAWCRDGRKIKLGLCGFDQGLVGLDGRLELIGPGLLLINELLGRDVLHHQCLGAHEVLIGGTQHRHILRLLRLGLVERGLEQARIDPRQHVTHFYVLAFGEQHLLHDAVDLGMDRDRERGLCGAETGHIDRHVLPGRNRNVDRHSPARRERGAGRRRPRRPIPVHAAARDHDKDDRDRDNDTAARKRTTSVARHKHLPRQDCIFLSYMTVTPLVRYVSARVAGRSRAGP